ncbi:hypothetical protein BGZ73_006780 [Actinomortierella ambigua]|nr:hypothetical protein BGZ73_006780 [Actinomortierella ambigua]
MHARDYSTNTAAYDRAKVLVLGDAGVGKSTLVHMLCHGEALRDRTPTVGCNIDVRLHTAPSSALRATAAGSSHMANGSVSASSSTSAAASTFIEFYDVSGSPSVQHPRSRHMFYAGSYHGIILVHDLRNQRSFENLWRWMDDFLEVNTSATSYNRPINPDHGSNDFELSPRGMPILVVGNKKDLMLDALPNTKTLHGGEAISVCSIAPSEFMPNTTSSIAFNAFFTRVIDSRYQRPSTTPHMASTPQATAPPHTPTLHTFNSPVPFSPKGNSPTSSNIPIMDFATFTAGSSTTTRGPPSTASSLHEASPSNGSARSHSPVSRSTTPTGARSLAASRPMYDRHRIGLGSSHAAAMGVPVYTHTRTTNSSRESNP